MPLVRNPSGREVVVPPGHWALTDPEFTVLPEPRPAPVAEPKVTTPKRKTTTKK